MTDDPIVNQIEGIGNRRLLGCVFKIALAALACIFALGLVVRHSDASVRTAVAFAVSGLLLGFTTSFLVVPDARLRRALVYTLAGFPVVVAMVMFGLRTLFGHSRHYPLLISLSPLMLPLGFFIGGALRRR